MNQSETLTEIEARSLICPFLSSDSPETDWIMCQGSKCMAWKILYLNEYKNLVTLSQKLCEGFRTQEKQEEYVLSTYGPEYTLVPTEYSKITHTNVIGIKQPYGRGYCLRIHNV